MPESTTSALQSNIREKGQNSYYYAHRKRPGLDDEIPAWDGQSAPRLLSKSETAQSMPLTLAKPITKYAWADGKKSIGIYMELPNIGSHADDLIELNWTPTSVELNVRGFEDANLVFKIQTLYEEVSKVTMKKKEDKLVLRLTKSKELSWFSLKKDNP